MTLSIFFGDVELTTENYLKYREAFEKAYKGQRNSIQIRYSDYGTSETLLLKNVLELNKKKVISALDSTLAEFRLLGLDNDVEKVNMLLSKSEYIRLGKKTVKLIYFTADKTGFDLYYKTYSNLIIHKRLDNIVTNTEGLGESCIKFVAISTIEEFRSESSKIAIEPASIDVVRKALTTKCVAVEVISLDFNVAFKKCSIIANEKYGTLYVMIFTKETDTPFVFEQKITDATLSVKTSTPEFTGYKRLKTINVHINNYLLIKITK